MKHRFHHLREVLVAIAALALSAGLAFGAQPESGWGLANASAHAGKTVPAKAGQLAEDTDDVDDDTDEDAEDVEDVEEGEPEDTDQDVEGDAAGGGDNCSTDPTGLTPEALESATHGSIVCWAAHQTEWPGWFTKHGEFVRCWAHHGKADAPSCTEDPNAGEPVADEGAAGSSTGHGRGPANGKGKAHGK